jgi:hypothetical protein
MERAKGMRFGRKPDYEWKRWFAWYPIAIERDSHWEWVWLETVERREDWFASLKEFYGYKYREIEG